MSEALSAAELGTGAIASAPASGARQFWRRLRAQRAAMV
ncbi:ABC transporter permease, partial [Streptomyces sp. T-3]|nr:ABC transporter permease [Streptomyces sp. T-3]